MSEANVPAEQSEEGQEPRLPAPDVDARRKSDPQSAAAQGPAQAVGLIWRIRERESFLALRQSRRRLRSGPITVTSAVGIPGDPPRVGFVIGRRVGGAVVRNRLRRRLRAIVADLGPMLSPDIHLIGAQAPATSLSFEELREHVTRALQASDGATS